jgi:beta-carotene 15,15'-dioxygenase
MIQSAALALLLGFELSYYLLIVQTGITEHYHSDLLKLFPLFVGGVAGTILSGHDWGKISNPLHKIYIALSLQLLLSFLYPQYNAFTLGLLGISVGIMAPLNIYLFKAHQRYELLFGLAIAYTVGTNAFHVFADNREWMAVVFSLITLGSALVLYRYKVDEEAQASSHSFITYLPLMLWILLDSTLFETLSRHEGLMIWSEKTYTITLFHLLGLLGAYLIRVNEMKQHLIIAMLFIFSYGLSYLEWATGLAMLYPFTISYYGVIVFVTLSKVSSLQKLSCLMVFIGWIASGLGLAIALSKVLH